MTSPATYRLYATSLLADVERAAESSLPRRGALADWLRDFLERSARRDYALASTERADLTAVHEHLRHCQVATSPREALH